MLNFLFESYNVRDVGFVVSIQLKRLTCAKSVSMIVNQRHPQEADLSSESGGGFSVELQLQKYNVT